MKSATPMPWMGFVTATAGAVLMVYSGPLTHAWIGTQLPTGLHVPVNWLLLIGMVTVIGGGLLVQITREDPHG